MCRHKLLAQEAKLQLVVAGSSNCNRCIAPWVAYTYVSSVYICNTAKHPATSYFFRVGENFDFLDWRASSVANIDSSSAAVGQAAVAGGLCANRHYRECKTARCIVEKFANVHFAGKLFCVFCTISRRGDCVCSTLDCSEFF